MLTLFVVLFMLSVVGWIVSLFFIKRTITPMLVFYVLVVLTNALITIALP